MNRFWNSLSDRERMLALATVSLFALAGIAVGVSRAMNHLAELDETMLQLESDLINFNRQLAYAQTVEQEYAKVASQHSSSWTKAEIHDRLRKEIFDLADETISIPSLPEGNLDAENRGYREYRIEFSPAEASVDRLAIFLRKLQESAQALRVDALELRRLPNSTSIASTFTVVRTVVDSAAVEAAPVPALAAEAQGGLIRNGSFEEAGESGTSAEPWVGQGSVLAISAQHATAGAKSLQVTASDAGAALYQAVDLEGGRSYDLTLDASAMGAITLGVRPEDGAEFSGAQTLIADGAQYRYHIRFAVPGDAGSIVPMHVPYVQLAEKDAACFIDNVALVVVEE